MCLKNKQSFLSTLTQKLSFVFIVTFLLEMLQTASLNSISVSILLIWAILLCNRDLIDFVTKSSQAKSLIAFEVLGLLSLIWSFAPMTSAFIIVNELAFFILNSLTAYSLVSNNKSIGESLKFTAVTLTLIVLLYSFFFYSSSTGPGGFTSFYQSKNGLGFATAICVLIMLCSEKKTFFEHFIMFTAFVFLILSQSKTSLNLVLLTILLLGITKAINSLLKQSTKFTQDIILLVSKLIPILLYLIITLLVIYRENIVYYLMNAISDDLFTGRGLLWRAVLSRSSDNLLLGIGPGAFWGAGRESEIAQTQLYILDWIQALRAADGGYIDLIGAFGFIGLAIVLTSLVHIYQLLLKVRHDKDAPLLFVLITFIMLHNITETDFYKFKDPLWYLYITIFFYLQFLVAKCKE